MTPITAKTHLHLVPSIASKRRQLPVIPLMHETQSPRKSERAFDPHSLDEDEDLKECPSEPPPGWPTRDPDEDGEEE